MGTRLLVALLAVPMANLLMGASKGAIAFVIPFAVSSAGGALIAYGMLKTTVLYKLAQEHRKTL